MAKPARPVAERIQAHVVVTAAGCWEWQATRDRNGYGRIWVGSRTDRTRRFTYAHIASWEAVKGPVPCGLELDHLCRNRAVTPRTNVQRGDATRLQQICLRGHALTDGNLDIYGSRRQCRECRKIRQRGYDAARKAREALQ